MHNFTPVSASIGGALIGLAASLLLIGNGRVAGISGIVGSFLSPERGEWRWRGLFLLGLLSCGVVALLIAPERIASSPRALPVLIGAGLLVGFGTRLGGGCTSGHGVCGIARFAPRSLAATVTFIGVAMIVNRLFTLLTGAQ